VLTVSLLVIGNSIYSLMIFRLGGRITSICIEHNGKQGLNLEGYHGHVTS